MRSSRMPERTFDWSVFDRDTLRVIRRHTQRSRSNGNQDRPNQSALAETTVLAAVHELVPVWLLRRPAIASAVARRVVCDGARSRPNSNGDLEQFFRECGPHGLARHIYVALLEFARCHGSESETAARLGDYTSAFAVINPA